MPASKLHSIAEKLRD